MALCSQVLFAAVSTVVHKGVEHGIESGVHAEGSHSHCPK
jgi:hypothetical protein